jgi:6-phosphofructokinase 1
MVLLFDQNGITSHPTPRIDMKRIAVLTSGGDAPGMNAAIRAVVRIGLVHDFEVYGVRHGYAGLIRGELAPLGAREVGGIIQLGGTVLGTSRCAEMRTDAGQDLATRQLREHGIDGLVVIGGNGSQTGAEALSRKGVAIIGVASTIDNDLAGTDITIGAVSAIDVALEAIDRLRTTASSHQRAFLVEMMGRDSGYLALIAGIAGGAESIVIPEADSNAADIAAQLAMAFARGKTHAMAVVAEGAKCNADTLAQYFKLHEQRLGFELRVSRLGHIQRGGAPGVCDRMLATMLGSAAVEHLGQGRHGLLLGLINGKVAATPLAEIIHQKKPLDLNLLTLARNLAR